MFGAFLSPRDGRICCPRCGRWDEMDKVKRHLSIEGGRKRYGFTALFCTSCAWLQPRGLPIQCSTNILLDTLAA